MKRIYQLLSFAILFTFTLNINLTAQEKPVQLALFNPIQIFPENTSIAGIRLNILYGKNTSVTGLDWGFVNSTTGVQKGVQFGFVNLTEGGFTGWQEGLVNVTRGNSLGLQSGGVSFHNGHHQGVQFSLLNYAETLNGLQLGIINIIGKGGFMPVFPIFNFDFE